MRQRNTQKQIYQQGGQTERQMLMELFYVNLMVLMVAVVL